MKRIWLLTYVEIFPQHLINILFFTHEKAEKIKDESYNLALFQFIKTHLQIVIDDTISNIFLISNNKQWNTNKNANVYIARSHLRTLKDSALLMINKKKLKRRFGFIKVQTLSSSGSSVVHWSDFYSWT